MEQETGNERGTVPSPEEREVLLGARVSNILAADERALGVMIEHGFTLLAQAPLRWAMAHTVNLGQAFRLRGLGAAEQEVLLRALADLGVPAALRGMPGAGAHEGPDAGAHAEQGPDEAADPGAAHDPGAQPDRRREA